MLEDIQRRGIETNCETIAAGDGCCANALRNCFPSERGQDFVRMFQPGVSFCARLAAWVARCRTLLLIAGEDGGLGSEKKWRIMQKKASRAD